MLGLRSHRSMDGSVLTQPAEVVYTLNSQSWSWQQAEYFMDAGTLAGLRQDSRAQLILIAQDAGENLKINLPTDLLSEAELSNGQLVIHLNFTSDANSRLRSRDYYWVILSQIPGQIELLMRPNVMVQEKHWPANFFQEVCGAWGDEFDQIEADLRQKESEP